jgi:UDP-3-O-[3-hydroxymyristoyl] glucosamine N-acyltransferase
MLNSLGLGLISGLRNTDPQIDCTGATGVSVGGRVFVGVKVNVAVGVFVRVGVFVPVGAGVRVGVLVSVGGRVAVLEGVILGSTTAV